MDVHGAKHLLSRLAIGAPAGARVEVVSVGAGDTMVVPGDAGTLLAIGAGEARVLFDSGAEIAVDTDLVRFRPLLRSA